MLDEKIYIPGFNNIGDFRDCKSAIRPSFSEEFSYTYKGTISLLFIIFNLSYLTCIDCLIDRVLYLFESHYGMHELWLLDLSIYGNEDWYHSFVVK